jgi:hypothetical protein
MYERVIVDEITRAHATTYESVLASEWVLSDLVLTLIRISAL